MRSAKGDKTEQRKVFHAVRGSNVQASKYTLTAMLLSKSANGVKRCATTKIAVVSTDALDAMQLRKRWPPQVEAAQKFKQFWTGSKRDIGTQLRWEQDPEECHNAKLGAPEKLVVVKR